MRYLGLVAALAACAAAFHVTPVAAQQAGTPMGDMMDMARLAGRASQWSATRRTPLSNLSHASKEWMKAEAHRQVETPRTAVEVAVSIDTNLTKDLRRLARTEGVRPNDVSNAILLQIMIDVQDIINHDIREARKSSPTPVANGPELDERVVQADLNRRAAMEMQTSTSLALVMM